MNTPFYIARRFLGYKDPKSVSRPAVNIAIAGIAIGLAVMLLAVCVVLGFKGEIRRKMVGFGTHIEVSNTNAFFAPDAHPMQATDTLRQQLTHDPRIASVQRFSLKPGMLKTEDDFLTIVLKGVSPEYDMRYVSERLVQGKMPEWRDSASANQIVISQTMADILHLKVGDRIFAYFFEDAVKTRRFEISGVYQTNMDRFDKTLVFGRMSTVNQLNGWTTDTTLCGGLDISIRDYDQLGAVQQTVVNTIAHTRNADGTGLVALSIVDRYPQVFSWLEILDVNVLIILILMIAVASFTMISGLLILILERTSAIGTLKALGANNTMLRHTFLYFAAFLVGRGLLWGNVIAAILVFVQIQWGVLHLDPTTYYVDVVPLEVNGLLWIGINIATLILTMLALIVPSFLVSHIEPAKSIRFD